MEQHCFTALQDTETFVDELAQRIENGFGGKDSASFVIGLAGDLGAGKTALVKMLARRYGCEDVVISPTFCFMREYAVPNSPFTSLIHIDAYRCADDADLRTTGILDACESKGNLVCIEWFDNVTAALGSAAPSSSAPATGTPEPDMRIDCSVDGDTHCFAVSQKKV